MKFPTLTALGILSVFLTACSPGITFREPQPPGGQRIERFPKRLQGDYVGKSSNTHLSITQKTICKVFDWDGNIAKNNIDSNYRLEGTQMISKDGSEKYPVQIEGDSFKLNIHLSDTVFAFSDKGLVIKHKGYFFLNQSNAKSSWTVSQLSLQQGVLSFGQITSIEDIDKLRQLTESADSTTYNFSPTKKQFTRFVKLNGFSDTEQFMKVK